MPFNESDGDEFENDKRRLPKPEQRRKAKSRARRQARRLLRENLANKEDIDIDHVEVESSEGSYDSEDERIKRRRAANLFKEDSSDYEEGMHRNKDNKERVD